MISINFESDRIHNIIVILYNITSSQNDNRNIRSDAVFAHAYVVDFNRACVRPLVYNDGGSTISVDLWQTVRDQSTTKSYSSYRSAEPDPDICFRDLRTNLHRVPWRSFRYRNAQVCI